MSAHLRELGAHGQLLDANFCLDFEPEFLQCRLDDPVFVLILEVFLLLSDEISFELVFVVFQPLLLFYKSIARV